MGDIIGFSGVKGVGKTTSATAVTTCLESILMDKLFDMKDYVSTILKVDANKLNELIDEQFLKGVSTKYKVLESIRDNTLINRILYTSYKDEVGEEIIEERLHYNYLKNVKHEDLLLDYIEARIAELRNNYVWCNITYNSIVTGQKSFDLDLEDFDVKMRMQEKDFTLRRYGIFFYDGPLLNENKTNINHQKNSQSAVDKGSIHLFRLFRHCFHHNSKIIWTIQDFPRIVKTERELFDTVVLWKDAQQYSYNTFLSTLLNIVDWTNNVIFKIRLKFRSWRRKEVLTNKYTTYKKIHRWIIVKREEIKSKCYIVFSGLVYETAKNAEKDTPDYEMQLYFPVKYSWGPTNTWEFGKEYDALVENSEKDPQIKEEATDIEKKIEEAQESLKINKRNNRSSSAADEDALEFIPNI